MTRKQRRYQSRKSHRAVFPACYMLYVPSAGSYVVDVDADRQTLKMQQEQEYAAKFETEQDAKEVAGLLKEATGLRVSVHPFYLNHSSLH